ncbi:hypothetical protein PV797_07650 [Clostridiaceae bacterium M8S5]|nr:hypothetical protein PV797_07650 [Clostridiaceae bacterium M8S5]
MSNKIIIKNKLLAITLILLVILVFYHFKTDRFNSNFVVGVIQTTSQDNESTISLYDNNYSEVNSINLEYGSMSSYFDLPQIHENSMFVIPKGIGNIKELTVVLEFNLVNGKHITHNIEQSNMNSFCVDNDFIYTVNTLNSNSIISRYNRTNQNLTTLTIKNMFIGKLAVNDEKLYAFGFRNTPDNGIESKLFIINTNDLSIIKNIKMSRFGHDQLGAVFDNTSMYFTNSMKYNKTSEKEVPSNLLSILNLKTYAINSIPLKEIYPFQIIQTQGNLYISHFNVVQGIGNKLTIYDKKSKSHKLVTFNHNLAQIIISGNKMFSTDGKYLYVYGIEGSNFSLSKRVDIYNKKANSLHYYVSGFFLK